MSLAILGDQMLYVVLPAHPEAAGVSVAALGIVLSANRFIRLAANPVSGQLLDRLGRRPPYLLGVVLAVLSTGGYLLAGSLAPLLACRLVWGVAFSLLAVGGITIVLDVTAAGVRGRSVGIYGSLVQLGTLVGLALSGVLSDRIGYRGTLAVYTPLTALGGIVAWLWVTETSPARRAVAAAPTRPERRGLGDVRRVLGALRGLDRRLLAPMFASFASHLAGSGILSASLGLYLRQAAARGAFVTPVASLTGLLLASRRLVGMLVGPAAGHLSDRPGRRRPVARAGVLAKLAGYLALAGTDWGMTTILLGVGLTALGEAILHPAVTAWVGDGAPAERRATTMGGLATVNDLGAAIGPVAAYALASTIGLGAAYGLCALVMLLAALALSAPRAGFA
jgi:MFS family permease